MHLKALNAFLLSCVKAALYAIVMSIEVHLHFSGLARCMFSLLECIRFLIERGADLG
jgi:hypothetical protein